MEPDNNVLDSLLRNQPDQVMLKNLIQKNKKDSKDNIIKPFTEKDAEPGK
jgi:hypothetical protein